MILSKNKILYVVGTHDCGKFIVTNCLKNNQDIYSIDYIGKLFNDYSGDLNKILHDIDKDKNLNKLINMIPVDTINFKYILLLSWNPHNRILHNIEGVIPIFLFRDVRVGWLVSEHKKEGLKRFYNISIDDYIKLFNNLLEDYLKIADKHNVLVFKFEDFLINKRVAYNRLCNDLNITHNYNDIPTTFREKSGLLSMFDVEKIIKFQKYVDNDQLSYISSKTKKYNEFFNYSYNLSKEDILEGLKI